MIIHNFDLVSTGFKSGTAMVFQYDALMKQQQEASFSDHELGIKNAHNR